jgi:hypothetical protein
VVNRLLLRFPAAENSFAGLQGKMNRITGLNDFRGIGKAFLHGPAHLRNSTVQANYYW